MKRKLFSFVAVFACVCMLIACAPAEEPVQACRHDLTYHSATVTCTQDGQIGYWECSLCGKYFADENAAQELAENQLAAEKLNHKNKVHHEAVPGTCEEYGTIEYWECPDCGNKFSDEACTNTVSSLSTSKTAHEFEDGVCRYCGVAYDDYYFTFTLTSDQSGYSVTIKRGIDLKGETELIVPGTYKGKPVTEAAAYAFSLGGLERVVFSEGLQKLNAGSLSGKDLRSVSLPSTLLGISGEVFAGAVTSSAALRPVPEKLTEITVADNNVSGLIAQNGVVYSKTGDAITAVEAAAPGLTGALTLPDTVEAIGDYAFFGSKLTSVALPDNLRTIGDYAFKGAAALTLFDIPEAVNSLGVEAFSYTQFDTIILPEGINLLSDGLFYSAKIKTVVIPEGVVTIGAKAFSSCRDLDAVVIPKSVKTIKDAAFDYTGVFTIYYGGGTGAQFEAIDGINSTSNSSLRTAWRYYYSETDTGADNIWHFEDNMPVCW